MAINIGQRELIAALSSAAAWPLAARAAAARREGQSFVAALREGLQKLGWVEGRNIQIDFRWAGT
jgi:hypothetical protein